MTVLFKRSGNYPAKLLLNHFSRRAMFIADVSASLSFQVISWLSFSLSKTFSFQSCSLTRVLYIRYTIYCSNLQSSVSFYDGPSFLRKGFLSLYEIYFLWITARATKISTIFLEAIPYNVDLFYVRWCDTFHSNLSFIFDVGLTLWKITIKCTLYKFSFVIYPQKEFSSSKRLNRWGLFKIKTLSWKLRFQKLIPIWIEFGDTRHP